jgi:hypothetical protein
VLAKMRLEHADAGFGVVENRRGERGVGAACREYVHEIVEAARAS